MARLTDTTRAALGYWWDLINGAAQIGLPVQDTVSMANDIARNAGSSLSFTENQAISTLYGYARRGVNASDIFQAADASRYIDADMISTPPWARDAQEQNTYPLYNVKFEYTYLDQAGVQQTGYRTSVFPDNLPGTVGELTAAVLDDAEGMANKYGHTLISVNVLRIEAV